MVRPLRWTQWVTVGSLAGALVVGIGGLFVVDKSVKFELGVETGVLVGSLAGIFAEVWVVSRDRRAQALRALKGELVTNEDTLDSAFSPSRAVDASLNVFPRLPMSAADHALTADILDPERDAELVSRLHAWRNVVDGLHHRLDLTELRTLASDAPESEIEEFNRGISTGGFLKDTRDRLSELQVEVARASSKKSRRSQAERGHGGNVAAPLSTD